MIFQSLTDTAGGQGSTAMSQVRKQPMRSSPRPRMGRAQEMKCGVQGVAIKFNFSWGDLIPSDLGPHQAKFVWWPRAEPNKRLFQAFA